MTDLRARRHEMTASTPSLLVAMGSWLKKNLAMAILFGLLGAAIGFASNHLLVRFGWADPNAPAAADPAWRALWMTLASSLACAMLAYWWTAGTKKFFQAIVRFPASLASLVRAGGGAARVHLLWGAGIAFLVSVLISPAIGAVVAAAVLLSLPSLLGGIISNFLFRLWSAITGLVSPTGRRPLEGAIMMAIGLAGSVLALVGGYVLTGPVTKLALAAACIALALLLGFASRDEKQP